MIGTSTNLFGIVIEIFSLSKRTKITMIGDALQVRITVIHLGIKPSLKRNELTIIGTMFSTYIIIAFVEIITMMIKIILESWINHDVSLMRIALYELVDTRGSKVHRVVVWDYWKGQRLTFRDDTFGILIKTTYWANFSLHVRIIFELVYELVWDEFALHLRTMLDEMIEDKIVIKICKELVAIKLMIDDQCYYKIVSEKGFIMHASREIIEKYTISTLPKLVDLICSLLFIGLFIDTNGLFQLCLKIILRTNESMNQDGLRLLK